MRPAYIRELAGWVSLDGNDISQLVDAAARQSRSENVSTMRRGEEAERESTQQPLPDQEVGVNLNDPLVRFERQVLEVLVQVPSGYEPEQLNRIAASGFGTPIHNAILKTLLLVAEAQRTPDWLNQIASSLPADLVPILREIAAKELPAADEQGLIRYAQGVVNKALMNALAQEKAELLAELRRLAPEQTEENSRIQKALVEIEAQRRKLQ
jgi:DNA primase